MSNLVQKSCQLRETPLSDSIYWRVHWSSTLKTTLSRSRLDRPENLDIPQEPSALMTPNPPSIAGLVNIRGLIVPPHMTLNFRK